MMKIKGKIKGNTANVGMRIWLLLHLVSQM